MTSMDYYPDAREWETFHELAMEIQSRKNYLRAFKHREKLSAHQRAHLVKFQLQTSKMISDLKMMVKKFKHVPQSVLEIYYWSTKIDKNKKLEM